MSIEGSNTLMWTEHGPKASIISVKIYLHLQTSIFCACLAIKERAQGPDTSEKYPNARKPSMENILCTQLSISQDKSKVKNIASWWSKDQSQPQDHMEVRAKQSIIVWLFKDVVCL